MKAITPTLQHHSIMLIWPLAALLSAMLGSCATPSPQPIIPAAIPVTPQAAPKILIPLTPSAPISSDWRDHPRSAGDWRWAYEGALSVARYGKAGESQLILSCNRALASVQLSRKISAPTSTTNQLTIRAATQLRQIAAQTNAEINMLTITLSASDSLWDAIAMSRGNFAITASGQAPIYAPSWPEVARVIEDCR